MTRVPRKTADIVQERARELGTTYSDYIAYVLATAHGVDVPMPGDGSTEQDRLPLTG